jgi:signal transduction histidine kinase
MKYTRAVPFAVRPRSATLGRMLVVLMVLVVASFLASLVGANLRGRTIGHDVGGIIDNAMPSVVLLSAARGELHRLDTYADMYVDEAAEGRTLSAEPFARYRSAVDRALARYAALRTFPGEGQHADELPPALAALDASIAQVLSSVAAGDARVALRALRDEERATGELDAVLGQLVAFNATEGQALAASIGDKRGRAIATAAALDGAAVLLTMIATTVAFLILRRSVRALEDERNELWHFAGRVAHDVLGPVSSVTLSLELIERNKASDPSIRAAARRGLSSARRVTRIVRDLLEFARAGARPDPSATVDLRTVLEDVVDGIRADAEEARVELVLQPGDTCDLACSSGVFTSLSTNIIRNAIKHMGEAVVRRVEVRTVARGDRCRVEVTDTGPGVPLALADKIFERSCAGTRVRPAWGSGSRPYAAWPRRTADPRASTACREEEAPSGSRSPWRGARGRCAWPRRARRGRPRESPLTIGCAPAGLGMRRSVRARWPPPATSPRRAHRTAPARRRPPAATGGASTSRRRARRSRWSG